MVSVPDDITGVFCRCQESSETNSCSDLGGIHLCVAGNRVRIGWEHWRHGLGNPRWHLSIACDGVLVGRDAHNNLIADCDVTIVAVFDCGPKLGPLVSV